MKLDEQVSYIFDVAEITDLSIAGQLIEMILVIRGARYITDFDMWFSKA